MEIINKQGYFWTEKNNIIPGQFIESDDLDFFLKIVLLEDLADNPSVIFCEIEDTPITCEIYKKISDNEFLISYIFINKKFNYENEIKSNKIILEIPHLNQWYNKLHFIMKNENNERDMYVEKIENPSKYTYPINDNLSITITKIFRYTQNFHEKIEIIEVPQIILNYTINKSFEEILIDLDKIKKFFMITYNCNMELNNIISVDDFELKMSLNLNNNFSFYKLLFLLSDITDNKDIFKKWFNVFDQNKLVFNIYFTTYHEKTFLEDNFLALTRSIEGYHKNREDVFSNDTTRKKNFKARLFSIILFFKDSIVINKILENNYLNYKSLSLDTTGFNLNNETERNLFKFATLITQNRNYYTHIKKRDISIVIENEKFFEINQYLKAIFDMCFLKEIGLWEKEQNIEELNDYINKIHRYYFL